MLCWLQQDETAMDVAERKQHPEIILIISSFSRVCNITHTSLNYDSFFS